MTSEAYTETSAAAQSEAASDSAESGTPVWSFIVSAIIAMVLICLLTVYLPKIAAAADRLLGRNTSPASGEPTKAEDFKVNDIYELHKDTEKKTQEDNSK
jgi:hypothetical protein